jgi:hypothetical protein
MNVSKSLILLPLVIVFILLTHIKWDRDDLGLLFTVDERPIDVAGHISDLLNTLSRDCASVERLTPSHHGYQLAERLIQGYSPPQSSELHIASAWGDGSWILVEVEFKDLLPAVVMIHTDGSSTAIVPHGIWSGYTHPHIAAPFIREFLLQRLNNPPLALISCFEPASVSFK